MPILARVNFLRGRAPVIRPDVDRRRLDLVDVATGAPLPIFNGSVGSTTYVALSGLTGLRMAPRTFTEREYPGMDGARIEQIRRAPRDVVIPLFVEAKDQRILTHLDQLDELGQAMSYDFNDYATDEGTLDLVATGQDGSTRRLRCYYVDGLEGAEGFSASNATYWSMFDVKLRAVDPLWRGEPWTTPSIGLPTDDPFLSDDPADEWPRRLSPAIALGADMPLSIPGRVPSPASVELIGPASTTRVASPGGLDVTIGPIADGDVFLLETGRRKRALLNGVDAWEKVGTSPKWRPLPPGETTITVQMSGATAASHARVFGESLHESAW
ncbi:hypothetical protein [Phycicoccus jejuensis]|uniref:hypothetical protein n=1 Tax=Phycicoccus jejuensis TaxID=367299 RepID=UPI0004C44B7C|nr:hypothetical protein [Phycicoccus jejuensis]